MNKGVIHGIVVQPPKLLSKVGDPYLTDNRNNYFLRTELALASCIYTFNDFYREICYNKTKNE